MNRAKRLLLWLESLWLWLIRLPRRLRLARTRWRKLARDAGAASRFHRFPWWRKRGDHPEENGLERDLWQAHRDWQLAQHRLDQANGADEVDYAVLMLEASEKRYGMLIKKAKAAGLQRKEWQPGAANKRVRHAASAGGRKEGTGWTRDG